MSPARRAGLARRLAAAHWLTKIAIVAAIDAVVVTVAMLLAIWLRYDDYTAGLRDHRAVLALAPLAVIGAFQLTGIYRIFLKVGSPQFILGRASRVFETYFRGTGKMEIVEMRDGFAELEIDRFDGGHADYCRRLEGYYHTVLRLSGAKDIQLAHPECAYRAGSLCRWTATWSR